MPSEASQSACSGSRSSACVRPAWACLLWGESPLYETGNFRGSVYQMTTAEREVLDEGNCGRVTDRGEEACEDVRKRWVCRSPPRHLLVKPARRRTETSYEAGSIRRARTTCRSRLQSSELVNDALVRGSITFLSGELCTAWPRPCVAPASKACLKPWNGPAKASPGGAELSRGHCTDSRMPIETGRTER